MARYRVPKDAGRFRIEKAMAGNWMVLNDKTGGGKIVIACREPSYLAPAKVQRGGR